MFSLAHDCCDAPLLIMLLLPPEAATEIAEAGSQDIDMGTCEPAQDILTLHAKCMPLAAPKPISLSLGSHLFSTTGDQSIYN